MEDEIERRIKPRIPMCWPVVLMTPQGSVKGMSEDISTGGVLILCQEPIDTENEVEITAKLSKDHEMSLSAKKIWSDGFLADDTIYYETGFCFTEISQDNREIIASLVEESFWA